MVNTVCKGLTIYYGEVAHSWRQLAEEQRVWQARVEAAEGGGVGSGNTEMEEAAAVPSAAPMLEDQQPAVSAEELAEKQQCIAPEASAAVQEAGNGVGGGTGTREQQQHNDKCCLQ